MRFSTLGLCLVFSSLGMGCSDYKVDSIVDSTQPGSDTNEEKTPKAEVNPETVDVGTICTATTQLVTLTNTGTADLSVFSISVSQPVWTLEHDELPLVVAPDANMIVTLVSSGGDATLTFETNDPETPNLTVPLSVTSDLAPEVSIISPTSSQILQPGFLDEFTATVSDDVDLAENMTVEWSSNIDGILGVESPTQDGIASMTWDSSLVTDGNHVVTVTVTDSCGSSQTDSVEFCQNQGYTTENLALDTWNFEGNANWDINNQWVELTINDIWQAGTAFQTSQTVDSSDVVIEFSFFVSGGSGADGISLTALDTTNMNGFVGDNGGGIGYGGLPGWSLEIDTWYNEEFDDPTTEDHLSVHINGNMYTPMAWAELPEMEDGNWHFAHVSVNSSWMRVAIDGIIYIDENIPGLTSFPAYVGFTGATGLSHNYHLIDSLLVENFVCEGSK